MRIQFTTLLALVCAGASFSASAQWALTTPDRTFDLADGVRCRTVHPSMPPEIEKDPWFRQAAVMLQAELVPPGRVRSVSVLQSSGYTELDEAAVAELKKMDCEFGTPLKKTRTAPQTFIFSQNLSQPIPVLPDAAKAFLSRGHSMVLQGKWDRAIADYDQAIALAPELAAAYAGRGRAWQRKGDAEKAQADLDKAMVLDWQRKGDAQKTLADLDNAILLYPRDSKSLIQRALLRFRRGLHRAATEDLEAALRVDPNPHTQMALAQVHFIDGQLAVSMNEFRQVIQQVPSSAYAPIWLFLAQARSGDAAGASDELRSNRARLDESAWPMAVIDFYLGRIGTDAMLAATQTDNARTRIQRSCEAKFYLAEWHMLQNKIGSARELLDGVERDCPKTLAEQIAAAPEMKRVPAE